MADRDHKADHDQKDLLAAYELGLLDDAERARFEAATREDADVLDDLFESAPDAMMLAQDPGRFAAAARSALADAKPRETVGLLHRLRGLLRVRVLVPVAVALAMVFMVLGPDGGDKSVTDLAVVAPLHATRQTVRADAPAAEARFRDAMDAYLDARWSDAAESLEEALAAGGDTWPRRDQAHLYLGSSLLLDGQAEAATTALEEATSASVLPVREQATWQLAHARLTLDDAAGARAALETLSASPVLAEKALALMAELDARD